MKSLVNQKRIVCDKDGADMVLIPAGEFEMGADASDIPQLVQWAKQWDHNEESQIDWFEVIQRETPRHKVYLDAFYMDMYEVTNVQYRKFVEATGRREPKGYHDVDGEWQEIEPWQEPKFNNPNQPVVCVMWYDALAYCEWAGKRLPTEAEWEKAARGGRVCKPYAWGDEPPDGSQANLPNKITHYFRSDKGVNDTCQYMTAVGSFPANNYGLYDMAGNVWEWCSDWFDGSYYEISPKENPKGPSSGEKRIMRGGSWYYYMSCGLRVADRSFDTLPTGSSTIVGFRCVKDTATTEVLSMSKFRRIGTTSLHYRDPRAENGQQREQEAVLDYITQAGRLKVDILLFQEEYSFTAADLNVVTERRNFAPTAHILPPVPAKSGAETAITLDDQYIIRVRETAEKAKVNVILPVLERAGERVYNSLVPISATGEVLRPYRKMFPVPGGEIAGGICPGEDNSAQLLAGVPVSFAICFDVHFDEVFFAARVTGAKLVLWSSMWMGGLWLSAQAIRYGFYIVSSTPDGCTFVDMDGTTIAESFTTWPQTAGQNNLIFEDLNFDREIFHCSADGKLNAIRDRYGSEVHIRNRPQDSIAIIETLTPELSIDAVKEEFGLTCWFDYIQQSKVARREALSKWVSTLPK